jgi:hypothetical protein
MLVNSTSSDIAFRIGQMAMNKSVGSVKIHQIYDISRQCLPADAHEERQQRYRMQQKYDQWTKQQPPRPEKRPSEDEEELSCKKCSYWSCALDGLHGVVND